MLASVGLMRSTSVDIISLQKSTDPIIQYVLG